MAGDSDVAGQLRPAVTSRWGVQRSEVLPSSSSLASFVAIGLFAGALVSAGVTIALLDHSINRLFKWWRG
jgi:hypothetical protein